MGLDMYLSAEIYVGGWDHNSRTPEGRAEIALYTDIITKLNIPRCESSPSLEVTVNVAYWRKANAIHAWFVDKVQGGKDECQKANVSREELQALVDECKAALKDKKADNLPPRSGFFFGSTDVDEYYWSDLADTVKQLEAALAEPGLKKAEFYYQSSW